MLKEPCVGFQPKRSIALKPPPTQWSSTVPPRQASVFIIDPHSIFRFGMATCLESMSSVGTVVGVDTVGDAWAHPQLRSADLVIIDAGPDDVSAFVRELRGAYRSRVLAYGSAWQAPAIVAMVEAGAVGVLAKDALSPDALEANVQAALHGAGVLPPDLLGALFASGDEEGDEPISAAALSHLTTREQDVLRLIADGHGTREVAEELSYSERTVKSVLHDAVTKLGARSRSHAVAHAVRAGLI